MKPTRAISRQERLETAARILREARETAGLSKAVVAAIEDVSRSLVVRWEDVDAQRGSAARHAPLDLALDPTLGPALIERLAAEHGLIIALAPSASSEAQSIRSCIPSLIRDAAALGARLHEATAPDGNAGESLSDEQRVELQKLQLQLDKTLASLRATLGQPTILRPLEGGKRG